MVWFKKSERAVATPAPCQPTWSLDIDRALIELGEASEVLSRVPWHRLRRFDQEVRRRTFTDPTWFPQRGRVGPGDVATLAARSGQPALVGMVLSMSANGFVRQAAVALLAYSDSEAVLPFLALRSADWVEQVRTPAAQALEARFEKTGIEALIALAPVLEPMAAPGARWASISAAYLDRIAARATEADLARAVSQADIQAKRWCARLLVRRGSAAAHLDVALGQSDQLTSRIIGEAAVEERPSDTTVLGALAASPVGSLRALALHRFQASDDPTAMALSDASLIDSSPMVRFLAQRFLDRRGVDVRARYRELLDRDPGAVAGFAEVARREDLDVVLPLLDHALPRVRSRATALYGRLVGLEGFDRLLVAMEDPSPSVARAACRVLDGVNLGPDRLEQVWRVARLNPAARPSIVALARRLDRWAGLTFALRALPTDDPDLRHDGQEVLDAVLERWTRTFTDPSPAVAGQIEEIRQAAAPALDPEQAEALDFALRPYLRQ